MTPAPLPVVLVVGSGAREHSIAAALTRHCAGRTPKLLCFGSARNPGIQALCAAYEVGKMDDCARVADFAAKHGATLAVIGPEAPLDAGVADALRAVGVAVVGPSKALSAIEGSKAFALKLLHKHGMAGLPDFREFTAMEGAREYLEELGEGNYVIKADGLCGGKGVKVAGAHLASIDEAVEYCRECLPHFVICEKLVGQEFSLLSLSDGAHLVHMPPLQDHKRAYEGDKGPNTGGMGSYSCADHLLPFLSDAALEAAKKMQAETIVALKAETGEPYRGVLYGGYMLTARGTYLIEYNARFGDPECLNVLSLLDPAADFLGACEAAAAGKGLAQVSLPFRRLASCCKYAVPEGYPNRSEKGFVVDLSGLQRPHLAYLGAVDADPKSGSLIATGSRTVGVVGVAETLEEAEALAEAEVTAIKGKLFHRRDVGTAALVNSRVAQMLSIQARGAREQPISIAVLGSTRGSSLQPVLRALASGALQGARIALVVSNKEDAPILERARQHGIRALHVPVQGRSREAYDAAVTSALEAAGVQAVLLVGYMRILSAQFCERWAKRCVNIHPSLLPAFAGGMDLQVHEAVLAAGAKETGCTVHYVEAEVDAGAPVVQRKCAVQPDDTPLSLKARVQALEGPALCDAPLAKATNRAGVMGSIGGFGGLFDTRAAGYKDPVLVSGTDGVGTKLIIAQATGKHGSIGIDLVAMVVNDLIVQGAEPLFFLDYFASGALDVKCAGEVVGGIARGCAACGCALVGGETAEMPGMYAPGHYDLAGFAVGAVERADILPRLEEIAPGDVLIGLGSSGVHSNGFSLVRRVVERSGLSWDAPAPFAAGATLADALLTPTKLYVKSCLAATRTRKVKALAHITGGGLPENLPRVLPAGVRASVDATAWTPPAVFGWMAGVSRAPVEELLRTFNCGVGMVLVVSPADATALVDILRAEGETAAVIGKLEAHTEGAGPQVSVTGTEAWGWA
ncbi:hypothetical protein EMIHUDRAFT_455883, partial [Emiliania huxleyi CCMP1516]|uniref:Phosphoribosylformylglycinamidine cyclo-ligase n=2 Tax=Emiliania huxleyi TaxID=2903 RepID=A0A0D3JKF4_EMIH1